MNSQEQELLKQLEAVQKLAEKYRTERDCYKRQVEAANNMLAQLQGK